MHKKFTLLILVATFAVSGIAQTKYEFPPSPLYGTLLNSITIEKDGRLKLQPVAFVFIDKTEGTLKVLKDGNEIGSYTWTSRPNGPPFYSLFFTHKGDPRGLKLPGAGNYELVYEAGGKILHRFKFGVTAKSSGSAYKINKEWKLKGPWENHAYLLRDDRESGKLSFKLWLRRETAEYVRKTGWVRVVNDKTGKVVAVGGGKQFVVTLYKEWRRKEFDLKTPGRINAKGEYYDNRSLRFNTNPFPDGGYTLNLYLSGNLYGAYKFNVKGGEIQMMGRQVRSKTEHENFIEGGGTAFWLTKGN